MNKIAIFPGSFKPPHIGHLSVVKKLLDNPKIEHIYIVISSKYRTIDNNLNNLNKKKIKELKENCSKYIKNIEKKNKQDIIDELKELIEKKKIGVITQDESYKIWKLYISTLSKKKQEKITIIKSLAKSPVQNGRIISLGKTIAKEGKKILFIKSEKNKIDKRFSFYEFTIGKNNIEYLILPHFKKLNSTNMRDCIYENDKKCLQKFIPKKVVQNVTKLLL